MVEKSIDVLKSLQVKGVVCHAWVESPNDSSQKYLSAIGFKPIHLYDKYWFEDRKIVCRFDCWINSLLCPRREIEHFTRLVEWNGFFFVLHGANRSFGLSVSERNLSGTIFAFPLSWNLFISRAIRLSCHGSLCFMTWGIYEVQSSKLERLICPLGREKPSEEKTENVRAEREASIRLVCIVLCPFRIFKTIFSFHSCNSFCPNNYCSQNRKPDWPAISERLFHVWFSCPCYLFSTSWCLYGPWS